MLRFFFFFFGHLGSKLLQSVFLLSGCGALLFASFFLFGICRHVLGSSLGMQVQAAQHNGGGDVACPIVKGSSSRCQRRGELARRCTSPSRWRCVEGLVLVAGGRPSSHQRSVSRCLRASASRYIRELLVAALGGLLIVKSLTESQLVANHFCLLQALFILCTIKH